MECPKPTVAHRISGGDQQKKRTRYFLRKSLYVDNTAVVADNGAEWKEIFGGLGLRVSLDSTVYGGALGRAAGKKTSRNKI